MFRTFTAKSALQFHYSKCAPSNQPPKSAILMIGWAGASPKHIEKYVKIYTDAGHHVALICPQRFHYKVPNSAIGAQIEPVFEEFKENPLMIHAFSMNGGRSVVSLWKHTGKERFEKHIQGILFDSAPSRPFSWQNAFAMALSRADKDGIRDKRKEKVYKMANDLKNGMLLPLLTLFPSLRSQFFSFHFLTDRIQLPANQYVLYSTADPISPAEHIEEFIGIQKARGNRVTAVNFGDSDHVAHFKSQPDLYRKTCLDFASKK